MKKFEDLKFKLNRYGGFGATHVFDNGTEISVQASKDHYCTPKRNLSSPDEFSSFEIAIWDAQGNFATKNFFPKHDEDIKGWVSRKEITEIIEKLT